MFRITEDLMKGKFYTVNEAAEKLNVSGIRIRKLCCGGRFEGAFIFGGVWMIPKASVNNFEVKGAGRPKKDSAIMQ